MREAGQGAAPNRYFAALDGGRRKIGTHGAVEEAGNLF